MATQSKSEDVSLQAEQNEIPEDCRIKMSIKDSPVETQASVLKEESGQKAVTIGDDSQAYISSENLEKELSLPSLLLDPWTSIPAHDQSKMSQKKETAFASETSLKGTHHTSDEAKQNFATYNFGESKPADWMCPCESLNLNDEDSIGSPNLNLNSETGKQQCKSEDTLSLCLMKIFSDAQSFNHSDKPMDITPKFDAYTSHDSTKSLYSFEQDYRYGLSSESNSSPSVGNGYEQYSRLEPQSIFAAESAPTLDTDQASRLKSWQAAGAALKQVLAKTSHSQETKDSSKLTEWTKCASPGRSLLLDDVDPMNEMLEAYTVGNGNPKHSNQQAHSLPLKDRTKKIQRHATSPAQVKSPLEQLKTVEGAVPNGLMSVRERIKELTENRLPSRNLTNSQKPKHNPSRKGVGNKHTRTCSKFHTSNDQENQSSSESDVESGNNSRHKNEQRCRRPSASHNENSTSGTLPKSDLNVTSSMSRFQPNTPDSTSNGKSQSVAPGSLTKVKPHKRVQTCKNPSSVSIHQDSPSELYSEDNLSEREIDRIAEKLRNMEQKTGLQANSVEGSNRLWPEPKDSLSIPGLGLADADSTLNLADVESFGEEETIRDSEDEPSNPITTANLKSSLLCCDVDSKLPACRTDEVDQVGEDELDLCDVDLDDLPDLVYESSHSEEEPRIKLSPDEINSLPDIDSDKSCSCSCVSDQDGEADDEFECDCAVCQERKARRDTNLMAADYPDLYHQYDSVQYDVWDEQGECYQTDSINLAELTPLDLLLMRDGNRELLQLMFQNVILQMLSVYPDLMGDAAPPPSSPATINSLPIVKVVHDDKEQGVCPICLCSFENEEEARQLPCQHLFHTLCIQAWLSKSGTCPVCRHVLTSDTS